MSALAIIRQLTYWLGGRLGGWRGFILAEWEAKFDDVMYESMLGSGTSNTGSHKNNWRQHLLS